VLSRYAGLMRGLALALALVTALAPAPGAAQAGKAAAVLRSVTGMVFQQPAGGTVRVVQAGAELAVGDTVGTHKGAFALVVFGDGSRVALRPESAMAIRGYSFKPEDPVNDQVSMQLLKGWLRVVSGQIGKRGDQAAFELKANDTTIGIRGTDFAVRICESDCEAVEVADVEGVLPQSGRLGRLLASAEPLRRLREGAATLDASADSPLFLGDVLVTGEVEAVIGLDDGTRIVLGPRTRVALRAEEDARERRAVRLDLLEGVLRLATPPQPGARLYAILVNAGRLVGVRPDTALDLACESAARTGGFACEAAVIEVRDGIADVLSVEGLRTLRGGSRARLVEASVGSKPRAEAHGSRGSCAAAPTQAGPAAAVPRVAPLQDDLPPAAARAPDVRPHSVQLDAPIVLTQRLFDPRDISVDAVRPPGAFQRPEPGVYAAVFDGLIVVANPAGQVLVPAGQGAFSAPDGKAPPRLLPMSPIFMERDRELERSRLAPGECIR
jgi:hypothetical protein